MSTKTYKGDLQKRRIESKETYKIVWTVLLYMSYRSTGKNVKRDLQKSPTKEAHVIKRHP